MHRPPSPFQLEKEKRELAEAEAFFRFAPAVVKYSKKLSGLSSSFIKTPTGILRVDDFLGRGSFGKVKKAKLKDKPDSVIKSRLVTEAGLENVWNGFKNEVAINSDLRDREESHLILRPKTFKKGSKTSQLEQAKIYQEMPYMGVPLSKLNKQHPNQIDLAIKLLIKIHQLHTGAASKSGTAYAHTDIKPDNVVLDDAGELRLIDFGGANTALDDVSETPGGTLHYLPLDLATLQYLEKVHHDYRQEDYYKSVALNYKNRAQQTTQLEEDTIATLRTIYFPKGTPPLQTTLVSIIDQTTFDKFPPAIQKLLDTTKIAALFHSDLIDTEQFYAAVLIAYQKGMVINESFVITLSQDTKQQAALITEFEQAHHMETTASLTKTDHDTKVAADNLPQQLVASSKDSEQFLVALFYMKQAGLLPTDAKAYEDAKQRLSQNPELQLTMIAKKKTTEKWLALTDHEVLMAIQEDLLSYKEYLDKFPSSKLAVEKNNKINELFDIIKQEKPDLEKLTELVNHDVSILSVKTHRRSGLGGWFGAKPQPPEDLKLLESLNCVRERLKTLKPSDPPRLG